MHISCSTPNFHGVVLNARYAITRNLVDRPTVLLLISGIHDPVGVLRRIGIRTRLNHKSLTGKEHLLLLGGDVSHLDGAILQHVTHLIQEVGGLCARFGGSLRGIVELSLQRVIGSSELLVSSDGSLGGILRISNGREGSHHGVTIRIVDGGLRVSDGLVEGGLVAGNHSLAQEFTVGLVHLVHEDRVDIGGIITQILQAEVAEDHPAALVMVLNLEADRHGSAILGHNAVDDIAIIVVVRGILSSVNTTVEGHISLVHGIGNIERIAISADVHPVVLT